MSSPNTFVAFLFVALTMAYCSTSLPNDSERRSVLGKKMETENKAVLYNMLDKVLHVICYAGGERTMPLSILDAGQN